MFPQLHSRFSLVIYFMHGINSVYMSIPISQFIPNPTPWLPPLHVHTFVLCICVSISALQISLSIPWASWEALAVKNPPANAGDIRGMGSIPGLGRSLGGGHDNPLRYSCLENPHGQKSLVGYSP